ncbi:hypothetical protein [Halobellus marinus]|uniref:hypothetical protein n=1 Tax=Halobellus TaxID=1073986 RepID=UPI0028A61BC5|nr:hypothetical protein [Halobellus sp. DFY28]
MNLPVTDDTLRTFVSAVGLFAALVVFTEHTVRSLAPVLILSAGMLTYSAMDEATTSQAERTGWSTVWDWWLWACS